MTIFSINSGSFGDVTVTGIVSASTLKGDGSQITSVSYDNIASKPTLISSSTQVTALLPAGTFSSSAQVVVQNTTGIGALATTGSNTLIGIQTISDTTNSTNYLDGAVTIAGGMSVRKDVRVSGSMTVNGLLTAVSMSTQYVTSSQYIVGDNKIILNNDDVTRFGGMSIIDSGSSSPTTASIFWDSLQHRFIYENLSGSSYNSSIIMAGPKHTGTLGDEVGLTDFRVPVAHGSDHIDSRLASSSIRVDFPSRLTHVEAGLYVTGSVTASSGVNAGISTLSSLTVSGDLTVDTNTLYVDATNNRVGVGTASPGSVLDVQAANAGVGFRLTSTTGTNGVSSRYSNTAGDLYYGIDTSAGGTFGKANAAVIWYTAAQPLVFATNNTEHARIHAGGGLSIGTTTDPGSGNIMLPGTSGTIFANTTASSRSYIEMYNSSTGDMTLGVTYSTAAIRFATGASNTERARITAGGDFYINVPTTGNAKLTVRGAGTTDSTYSFEAANSAGNTRFIIHDNGISRFFGSSGAETVRIDASGNLGVGTASPNAKLTVGGAVTTNLSPVAIFDSTGNKPLFVGQTNGSLGLMLGHDGNDIQGRTGANFATNGDLTINRYGGNVGIGTTSPSSKLHVEGQTYINHGSLAALYIDTTVADSNTRDAIYLYENDGQATGRQAISWWNANENYYKARIWTQVGSSYNATIFGIDVANNARTVATRLAIYDGNVGIGTNTPQSINSNMRTLEVSGDNGAYVLVKRSSATAGTGEIAFDTDTLYVSTKTNHAMIFRTNDTNRASIGTGGTLQCGLDSRNATENTAQFIVQGSGYGLYQWLDATAAYIGQNSTIRELRMYAGSSPTTGVKLTNGATSWVSTSDIRNKDIIENIDGAIEKIGTLSSIVYSLKDDEAKTRRVGLIAQEVFNILPEAVYVPDNEHEMLGIRYTEVIPLLVAAIKELTTMNKALEAEVAALKNQ